jgi:hypothetical protein
MTDKKTKTKEQTFMVSQQPISQELVVPAKEPAAPKNKGGRPTSYTEEMAETLCIRLGLGESLKKICSEEGMPGQATVYTWLLKHPEFQEMYTRAREEQAETHADEIVSIADETPAIKEIKDKDGNVIDISLDSAFIAWQKNRIEARKWNAAKQRPRKYGDRITHSGDDDAPVVVENNMNVFGELLKAIKMERQAKAYGDK